MSPIGEVIHTALSTFCEPGQIIELRILSPRCVVSGFFDDPRKLAAAAQAWNGRANLYFTPNIVSSELLALAYNRLIERPKHTTGDGDIAARRFVLIDVDAVRPVAGIAASDREHAAALVTAEQVHRYLIERGVPAASIVMADSGNGGHLMVRADLANDAAATNLHRRVLRALGRFDGPTAKIDQTTHNASRIWRLPGALNLKGDELGDRRHRVAHLLTAPEPLAVCLPAVLEAIAALAPSEAPCTGNGKPYDVDAFLQRAGLEARRKSWNGGNVWELSVCPFKGDEHGVDGAARIEQHASGAVSAGCHHDRCAWTWDDLRAKFDPKPTARVTEIGQTPDTDFEDAVANAPSKMRHPPPKAKPEVFTGLVGRVVQLFEPHTEADPVGIAAQFLVAFGNAIGRGPTVMVGETPHHCNENLLIVGTSARARKGDSWWIAQRTLRDADPDWGKRIKSGLSSGEGLIFAVRDASERTNAKGETVDKGEPDKRLLAHESEFSAVLKNFVRDGNKLSNIIRDAWDSRPTLSTLITNSPTCATAAHVSVIGHCTPEDLAEYLCTVELANGLANRFLFVLVCRARELPIPGQAHAADVSAVVDDVRAALEAARTVTELRFTPRAEALWRRIYSQLTADRPGLLGKVLARAEAHVIRLGMIYALQDGARTIDVAHLHAALALWDVCAESAGRIFADRTGDANADRIREALDRDPRMTLTDIRERVFGAHIDARTLKAALDVLEAHGVIRTESVRTAGRPMRLVVRADFLDAREEKPEKGGKPPSPPPFPSLSPFSSTGGGL